METHTSELVDGLVELGIDVEVFTARRDTRKSTVAQCDGYRVHTFPQWRTQTMSISPRLLWAALRQGAATNVMHVHSYHATTAIALLRPCARTVFTPHYHGKRGHTRLANVLHLGFYHLGKVLFRRSDAVVCVSQAERAQLARDFPSISRRVTVIPNGVHSDVIRTAEPFTGEAPTVLCVSRLEPYKRVADVVRAFALVPGPAQLVIIGDGSQRAELWKLIEDLDLGHRVTMLGTVSDVVLYRWFRTAQVLASMSEREAFGMVALEAASGGARVVLSDIPAHREIVDDFLGADAVLCPDRSPESLADAIAHQLAAPGAAATRVPKWSDIAARTLRVYETVSEK